MFLLPLKEPLMATLIKICAFTSRIYEPEPVMIFTKRVDSLLQIYQKNLYFYCCTPRFLLSKNILHKC